MSERGIGNFDIILFIHDLADRFDVMFVALRQMGVLNDEQSVLYEFIIHI